VPQCKQIRPFVFPIDKPVLVMPRPQGCPDTSPSGLLDEFAIWASRFGRRLTLRRLARQEGRHEA